MRNVASERDNSETAVQKMCSMSMLASAFEMNRTWAGSGSSMVRKFAGASAHRESPLSKRRWPRVIEGLIDDAFLHGSPGSPCAADRPWRRVASQIHVSERVAAAYIVVEIEPTMFGQRKLKPDNGSPASDWERPLVFDT